MTNVLDEKIEISTGYGNFLLTVTGEKLQKGIMLGMNAAKNDDERLKYAEWLIIFLPNEVKISKF